MDPRLPSPDSVTLGIIAGGRGSRLGGMEKAWLTLDRVPQVSRLEQVLRPDAANVLVSANRSQSRYRQAGFSVVADRLAGDWGPLAGLDALANACRTPWLLTVPVDLVHSPGGLVRELWAAGKSAGAFAVDDDGPQPLVALWPNEALRRAMEKAIACQALAVKDLQATLGMKPARLRGVRFGNLNTFDDLASAGIQPPR
ncbi:MAG: molybdenum cofactor guanylyltransferase [Pseudomonadota bacterium]|nr:molybdenum cofactor guanylyltransferase [Pseudomonadota bacterium]